MVKLDVDVQAARGLPWCHGRLTFALKNLPDGVSWFGLAGPHENYPDRRYRHGGFMLKA
ncbi:hypothetical protein O9993_10195 [Vibrio lentus]|nr:hypothetical protein [Vibrio lentus]